MGLAAFLFFRTLYPKSRNVSYLCQEVTLNIWHYEPDYLSHRYTELREDSIKDYDSRFGIYKLGFPNLEVEEGFVKYLLPFYTSVSAPKTPFEIGRFVREVE